MPYGQARRKMVNMRYSWRLRVKIWLLVTIGRMPADSKNVCIGTEKPNSPIIVYYYSKIFTMFVFILINISTPFLKFSLKCFLCLTEEYFLCSLGMARIFWRIIKTEKLKMTREYYFRFLEAFGDKIILQYTNVRNNTSLSISKYKC